MTKSHSILQNFLLHSNMLVLLTAAEANRRVYVDPSSLQSHSALKFVFEKVPLLTALIALTTHS